MADTTFLDLIPGFTENEAAGWLDHLPTAAQHPLINPTGHISMVHVGFGVVAVVLITTLAAIASKKFKSKGAVIPDGKLTIANFFETIFDAVFSMMEGMMGEKQARRFFPLIGSLAIFIFISNLMGLVPGFIPPTQSWNTTFAATMVVFIVYNIAGIREHGIVNYVKHFMGPVWWLAPLIFCIEIVSHIARPTSLGIRITGNMSGDHMVLSVFGNLAEQFLGAPVGLPIPIYFLGLLVCTVQALVFCLLSSVYISLAVAHDDH